MKFPKTTTEYESMDIIFLRIFYTRRSQSTFYTIGLFSGPPPWGLGPGVDARTVRAAAAAAVGSGGVRGVWRPQRAGAKLRNYEAKTQMAGYP